MDSMYFTCNNFPGDIFWYDEPIPVPKTSDFVKFRQENNHDPAIDLRDDSNSNNMNKRVIEFLRRSVIRKSNNDVIDIEPDRINEAELEKERCFRHMMTERMRREKQKQSYFALHSLLPLGTKNDKNTIVRKAMTEIQELETFRDVLRHRKAELEAVLAGNRKSACCENERIRANNYSTKVIRVKLAYPTSRVDSMVELLNCLKMLGLKAKNICSVFAEDEFSAELEIETKVEAAEIEEAIQVKLYEADLKFRCRFLD